MKKFSDYQDVESEEDSKVCNPDQDICYGTLTISNVNITVSDGKSLKEVVECGFDGNNGGKRMC